MAGPKETNVLTVIPNMHGIILVFSSAVSSGGTNVLAMIPVMHDIKLALSNMTI